MPPFVVAVLIIPSFHVFRSYFCFSQFGVRSLILNFEKLRGTAPLALNQFLHFDSELHSNLLTAISTQRPFFRPGDLFNLYNGGLLCRQGGHCREVGLYGLRSEKFNGPFRNGH